MAKDIRVVLRLDSSDFDRGIAGVNTKLNNLETTGSGVASSLKGAFAAIVGAATIDQFIRMADAITGLQNKLQVVVGSQQAANDAFNQITGIASRTRSSLTDVGDLYSKVALAGEQLGLSQGQVAQTTETFTKALKLTGASGAQASAAILQFGQALASGVLSGDEFRSLMENAPGFMRKFSEVLGISQGELRKLAKEQVLTADIVIAATQQMSASVDEDFGKTIPTISDAFENLRNNIMLMFIEMNEATGIFEVIRQGINLLANNIGVAFKFIGAMIAFALGAKAVALIFNFIKALQALRTATKAQTVAQIALLAFGGPAGLAALAAGAAAAAAAYIALDAAIPDRFDIPNLETSDLGSAPDARAMLEASKARAQAQKDAARATRTAAREAASEARRMARERQRDLERARDQLITIKEQTQSLEDQYGLDVKRLFLSNEEADLQQKLLDIEKERRRQLAEVSKLERLTPAERAAQEQKINDTFDARLGLLKDIGDSMMELRAGMDYTAQLRNITSESKAFAADLETRKKLLTEFNSFRIQQITDIGRIEADYARQREVLESVSSERIAAMKAVDDTDAITREEANLKRQIDYLNKLKNAQVKNVEERIASEEKFYNANITFAQGWAQAYGQYFENLRVTVNDQASYAKRIFNTITDGFTNSIMKFVETGKLSFKDLFKSLMMEIIKMQVNKLFLSIFGKGGPMGSLFAGMFANGGMIPGGKFGIAGERGPEIVTGPARVVSTRDTAAILGGGGSEPSITQVTYNIQAVDSMSFKQMLARDPEFLFNATRAGARRVPR